MPRTTHVTLPTSDDGAVPDLPANLVDWQMIGTAPGAWESPSDVGRDAPGWIAACVPGTVTQALIAAHGLVGDADVDGSDWWFCGTVGDTSAHDGPWRLSFDGVATISELYVPRHEPMHSIGMWRAHELVVDQLTSGTTIFVACRALAPRLRTRRRPAARWRSYLVPDGELRWWRTSLVGRIPSWSPAPPAVGLHGDVRIEPVRPGQLVRASIHQDSAADELHIALELVAAPGCTVAASFAGVTHALQLDTAQVDLDPAVGATARWTATVSTAGLARWRPHTHGTPVLHDLEVVVTSAGGDRWVVLRRRIGLRRIELDEAGGGFGLVVDGQRVFARGACWVPLDPVSFRNDRVAVRAAVAQLAAAGANLIRVTGTATYEDEAFHDACDELGVMVWQDLMFSNVDVPASDPAVADEIAAELANVLPRIAAHASTAVVCGGNEVEQQAAMMGADPSCWERGIYRDLVPELVGLYAPGVGYVANSPTGGAVPFRISEGVAHWFGVGGYRRPLAEVRSASVRFASECLAFANLPEPTPTEQLLAAGPVGSAPWKHTVVRDRGASWDFEDVRDTYVAELFDLDPAEVRAHDPMRYLDLGRMATGEAMATVFGFWRTARARCNGGIVLQARDWSPGSGWGIVDAAGGEKSVWWYLRRAWSPRTVLVADDGLDGMTAHVINERDTALRGLLRVQRWLGERSIEHGEVAVQVGAASVDQLHLDAVLGGFRDLGWAYRFGPPGHDAVVVELHDDAGSLVDRVVHLLPHARVRVGRPDGVELSATVEHVGDARLLEVSVSGGPAVVAVEAPGWLALDNYVVALPGLAARIELRPGAAERANSASVRVVAGRGELRCRLDEPS